MHIKNKNIQNTKQTTPLPEKYTNYVAVKRRNPLQVETHFINTKDIARKLTVTVASNEIDFINIEDITQ